VNVNIQKEKMTFSIGDQVIHPRHGLGQVTKLAIKQFVEGQNRPFYEIAFPGSTLWVPLSSSSGIRKLTAKNELTNCRRLLQGPAKSLNPDFRMRLTELKNRINIGTLKARCEVVRDLTAFNRKKQLSGLISAFFQTTIDVLYQEWSAIEGITKIEASNEIQSLLTEGEKVNDNN